MVVNLILMSSLVIVLKRKRALDPDEGWRDKQEIRSLHSRNTKIVVRVREQWGVAALQGKVRWDPSAVTQPTGDSGFFTGAP